VRTRNDIRLIGRGLYISSSNENTYKYNNSDNNANSNPRHTFFSLNYIFIYFIVKVRLPAYREIEPSDIVPADGLPQLFQASTMLSIISSWGTQVGPEKYSEISTYTGFLD
jgi:hypothetical protein